MEETLSILAIEMRPKFESFLSKALGEMGHKIQFCGDIKQLLSGSEANLADYNLVIIDPSLPLSRSKVEFLESLLDNLKQARKYFVVVTNQRSSKGLIASCYSNGCSNYIDETSFVFGETSLQRVLKNYFSLRAKEKFNALAGSKLKTWNPKLKFEVSKLRDIALTTEFPIHVFGPTGTGKTSLARIIHEAQHGNLDTFVELNCSNFQESLFESELFGYKKGAFSDAKTDKKGLLERADGGTLFLDEIGALSRNSQERLLKVIEEGVFYPVGSIKPVKVKFRLISATCDDLAELVKEKRFREDLFYRISGINLRIPPLSERKDDILPLFQKFQDEFHLHYLEIEEKAQSAILGYSWPGNVRELKRLLEICQAHTRPFLRFDDLPEKIRTARQSDIKPAEHSESKDIEFIKKHGFDKFVQELRLRVFGKLYNGNSRKFSRVTGMSSPTVQKLKKQYEERFGANTAPD